MEIATALRSELNPLDGSQLLYISNGHYKCTCTYLLTMKNIYTYACALPEESVIWLLQDGMTLEFR